MREYKDRQRCVRFRMHARSLFALWTADAAETSGKKEDLTPSDGEVVPLQPDRMLPAADSRFSGMKAFVAGASGAWAAHGLTGALTLGTCPPQLYLSAPGSGGSHAAALPPQLSCQGVATICPITHHITTHHNPPAVHYRPHGPRGCAAPCW